MARGEVRSLDVEFTADMIMAVLAPSRDAFLQQQCGTIRARIAADVRQLFIEGFRYPTSAPEQCPH